MLFSTLATVTVAVLSTAVAGQAFELPPYVSCGSSTHRNDIHTTYPGNATGILNGTMAIIPLKLDLVRAYIPAKYQILTHAYRALLPQLPEGMYPALLQTMHDHDVRMGDFRINDFQRAAIEFPFIDLLGDNTTSFRWLPEMFVSASNPIAVEGVAGYGTEAIASTFSPSCDAWAPLGEGKTSFNATASSDESTSSLESVFEPASGELLLLGSPISPHSLSSFFVNATNQPIFGNASTCDNQIRIFDPQAKGDSPWAMRPVTGSVSIRSNLDPLSADSSSTSSGGQTFTNLLGAHYPSRFIENNHLPCSSLQFYSPAAITRQLGYADLGAVSTAAIGAQMVLLDRVEVANASDSAAAVVEGEGEGDYAFPAFMGFARMVRRGVVWGGKRMLGF